MKALPTLLLVSLWPWPGEAPAAEPAKGEERTVPKLRRPDPARYQPSPPLRIVGDGDHLIERRLFQPRAGEYAIRIDNHFKGRVIIRDCIFRGTNGPATDGLNPGNGGGVLAWQSSHLLIESNVFEFIQGFCVRVFGSTNHPVTDVRVVGNDLYCLQAEYTENSEWGWTADGIQFIRVSGPGNAIIGNRCLNEPGRSYLTDFVNVYCSSGSRDSPFLVTGNILVGAGRGGLYNQYGCGIQLNDHPPDEDGGEFVDAVGNVLVDPGIVGININGGYRARVLGNTILMANVLRTNLRRGPVREHPAWAAITLFNYSGGISRDSGHEVRGNRAAFRQPGGTPFINKTQPRDTLVESNDWSATFNLTELLGR